MVGEGWHDGGGESFNLSGPWNSNSNFKKMYWDAFLNILSTIIQQMV